MASELYPYEMRTQHKELPNILSRNNIKGHKKLLIID